MQSDDAKHEERKREWTDQYVAVDESRPELRRFAGRVGRVVTVNWNNKAIVDFGDGAWYDLTVSYLRKLDPTAAKASFNAAANSAQPHPARKH
jgi:hypothetical protein